MFFALKFLRICPKIISRCQILETFYTKIQAIDNAKLLHLRNIFSIFTAQKMKFSIKELFSKCGQIRSFLRIWSHLPKIPYWKTSFFVHLFLGRNFINLREVIIFHIFACRGFASLYLLLSEIFRIFKFLLIIEFTTTKFRNLKQQKISNINIVRKPTLYHK